MVSIKTTLILCLVGHVVCRPQQNEAKSSNKNVTVVKSDIVPLDAHGSASYDIELSDGTKLKQAERTERPPQGETGSPSIVIEGSYSYIAPDGKEISITYIADKNGFQPKGDAIPTLGLSSSSSSTPASAEAPAQSSPAIDVPAGSPEAGANAVENEAEPQKAAAEESAAPAPAPQQSNDAPVFEKR